MYFSCRNRLCRGFGLLELIVVLVLLALLAAVAWPRFAELRGDAHRAQLTLAAERLRSTLTLLTAKWHAAGAPETLVLEDGTKVRFVNGAPSATSLIDYPGWRVPGYFLVAVHGHSPQGYLIHCDPRTQEPCGLPGTRCSFTYFNAPLPDSQYRLDLAALADPTCN